MHWYRDVRYENVPRSASLCHLSWGAHRCPIAVCLSIGSTYFSVVHCYNILVVFSTSVCTPACGHLDTTL